MKLYLLVLLLPFILASHDCPEKCKCENGTAMIGGKTVNKLGYCEYYCKWRGFPWHEYYCGNGMAYSMGRDCKACKKLGSNCNGGSKEGMLDCCSTSTPCGIGQGDCDHDLHCAGDLVCGKNNCGYQFWSTADCCTTKEDHAYHHDVYHYHHHG